MTVEEAVELHRSILKRVFDEEYFPQIAAKLMAQKKYESIELTTCPWLIQSFWDSFWFALPDARCIRKTIFFSICELAEGSYVDH